ncbi:MAG: YdcF family protein [Gammaproteobacteria bacterium]|nr:YdcF family protein [Gammaproteobacteria bacterium]NBT43428.1 YdcF family protein [Gammaproteobacteria bacterium]NBY22168.1 YdcF family protein [Gammaproteobacteria bacterium]NDE33582.1 YdcF family protein [Gammaproteobacteria bacterium]NDE55719.1 YdcF family protein [Gammaproteobacteria bacterium]
MSLTETAWWLMGKAFGILIVPPFSFLILALTGSFLYQCSPRVAQCLIRAGLWGILVLSLPHVSKALMAFIEVPCVSITPDPDMDAIVVLGGGVRLNAPEYGGDVALRPLVLERVRYAARLHQILDLPILVSGGTASGTVSEARAMGEFLEKDYGIRVRWEEGLSKTTRQNATLSAALLKKEGVKGVVLVSQGWHLRRAAREFERQGLKVQAAGTGCETPAEVDVEGFVPDIWALVRSYEASHEILGFLWYSLIYRWVSD